MNSFITLSKFDMTFMWKIKEGCSTHKTMYRNKKKPIVETYSVKTNNNKVMNK